MKEILLQQRFGKLPITGKQEPQLRLKSMERAIFLEFWKERIIINTVKN